MSLTEQLKLNFSNKIVLMSGEQSAAVASNFYFTDFTGKSTCLLRHQSYLWDSCWWWGRGDHPSDPECSCRTESWIFLLSDVSSRTLKTSTRQPLQVEPGTMKISNIKKNIKLNKINYLEAKLFAKLWRKWQKLKKNYFINCFSNRSCKQHSDEMIWRVSWVVHLLVFLLLQK